MAAGYGTAMSQAKLRDSAMLPALLVIAVFFFFQKQGMTRMPQLPTFVQVDTLSEANWTHIETPKLSLTRVHYAGLLHHKVWIVPFDEMWHIGLSERSPRDTCPGTFGPVEAHITSGASVSSAVSEVAGRVKRNRRVAPLMPLGRPFLLEYGNDREVVHVFALLVQGVFPQRSRSWFPRVLKPVQFIKETAPAGNTSAPRAVRAMEEQYCYPKRARWLARAVSYAMRRFKLKGIVPTSNPMDGASFDEAICCHADIDRTEDLTQCALKCDDTSMYNIISVFPQAR